ncbi:Thioredoxin-like fold [Pseudocohnilembus persalinus]|uniref:Glutathione peroxidase n=1 Tax=Pseudocohnilembus persalinus TaxID=266149 RepID=A0A0V0R5M6_PSEPJ|nr:Thioredoxin-like fold [Pseudocohnilembus persalinus]|eukprot:KRX09772.1 Thioredoxin-like fold [Pseudocohnilembus persalinus]
MGSCIIKTIGKSDSDQITTNAENLFQLSANEITGQNVELSKFQQSLTVKNYQELDKLYDKYKDQGFEILAFPCNQFGKQEPLPNDQILEAARKKANVQIKYPFFQKIEVNGPNTHEVYKFMKINSSLYDQKTKKTKNILWNFGKFLIDKNGKVVSYHIPTVSPLELEDEIVKLLKQ